MKYQMQRRVRRGFALGEWAEASPTELAAIKLAAQKVVESRLLGARPCGCYAGGPRDYNPDLKRATGVEKDICAFHATRVGDAWVTRWSGTLSEIAEMNGALGREPLAGLAAYPKEV